MPDLYFWSDIQATIFAIYVSHLQLNCTIKIFPKNFFQIYVRNNWHQFIKLLTGYLHRHKVGLLCVFLCSVMIKLKILQHASVTKLYERKKGSITVKQLSEFNIFVYLHILNKELVFQSFRLLTQKFRLQWTISYFEFSQHFCR